MKPSSKCKFFLRNTEFLSSFLDFKTKFFKKFYICIHTLLIVCKFTWLKRRIQHTIISIFKWFAVIEVFVVLVFIVVPIPPSGFSDIAVEPGSQSLRANLSACRFAHKETT